MADKVKFKAFPTAFKFGNLRARAWANSPLLPLPLARPWGRKLAGPGLGPRLRFNPAGPCSFHALRQSCRTLRETPSLRAKGNTASPASSRLIAANLNAVGKAMNFTLLS